LEKAAKNKQREGKSTPKTCTSYVYQNQSLLLFFSTGSRLWNFFTQCYFYAPVFHASVATAYIMFVAQLQLLYSIFIPKTLRGSIPLPYASPPKQHPGVRKYQEQPAYSHGKK
jgi:hypothetical protein